MVYTSANWSEVFKDCVSIQPIMNKYMLYGITPTIVMSKHSMTQMYGFTLVDIKRFAELRVKELTKQPKLFKLIPPYEKLLSKVKELEDALSN